MAFDYFTIQALAQELRARLQGAVIERAYASPRNSPLRLARANGCTV